MSSAHIYVDESGDLGWKFDKPYRKGGSSRHLTISAVCVPETKRHLPKRVIKDLYQEFKWPPTSEMKWSDLDTAQRERFGEQARKLCASHTDIHLHAIIVKKENVLGHIRADSNKLYNYMVKTALIKQMAQHDVVHFFMDERTIKVASGNSLHDYLQTELWFTQKATTNLVTEATDSKKHNGIQFADLLAGAVQSQFEDNDSTAFKHLAGLDAVRLFF